MEIIVVDDGSSDGSADHVRGQFPGVIVIQETNQGVAAARNKVIANATGEWIAFINAGDIWLPGKLQAPVVFALRGTEWHLLDHICLFRRGFQ